MGMLLQMHITLIEKQDRRCTSHMPRCHIINAITNLTKSRQSASLRANHKITRTSSQTHHNHTLGPITQPPFTRDMQETSGIRFREEIGRVPRDDG
jgi:hypothetical protein